MNSAHRAGGRRCAPSGQSLQPRRPGGQTARLGRFEPPPPASGGWPGVVDGASPCGDASRECRWRGDWACWLTSHWPPAAPIRCTFGSGPGLIDARNDASRHGAQTDDYGGPAAGRRAGGTGRRGRDRLVVGAHRCGL